MKFTDKVKALSQEGLVKFVETMEKTCPSILKELNESKLQIKMSDFSKEEFAKVFEFLENQEVLGKKNMPLYIDKYFALNVCKYFNKIEPQVQIYGMLEFYEEAVKLALTINNLKLAKKYANMPSDDTIRKKLWIEIAKNVLLKCNPENTTGLEIVNESKYLTVGDVLPFVSPEVKLSTFKDELLKSLKTYGSKITEIKNDMKDFDRSSLEIDKTFENLSGIEIPISSKKYCEVCEEPLLGANKIYVFPCTHGYHKVL